MSIEANSSVKNVWDDFEPDVSYTIGNTIVALDKRVLAALRKFDPAGKHLKAIRRGRIAPRGQANGLIPSEIRGYALKTKVLGRGGAVRVHARLLEDGTLYFDCITRH